MTVNFSNQPANLRPFTIPFRAGTTYSQPVGLPSVTGNRLVTFPKMSVSQPTDDMRPLRFDADGFVETDDSPLNPYARAFFVVWLLAALVAVCASCSYS